LTSNIYSNGGLDVGLGGAVIDLEGVPIQLECLVAFSVISGLRITSASLPAKRSAIAVDLLKSFASASSLITSLHWR
jgi:hypothetical protein